MATLSWSKGHYVARKTAAERFDWELNGWLRDKLQNEALFGSLSHAREPPSTTVIGSL
jgi:hypothetical protein